MWDRGNPHDRNAIRVYAGGAHVSLVPRDINEGIAAYPETGRRIDPGIEAVVGGTVDMPTVGVVMRL